MRERTPRWLSPVSGLMALAVALVGLAALAGGLIYDRRAFASHILAVVFELSAGVFVGLYVVEKIGEANRRQRWAGVSANTLATLDAAVLRAGYTLYQQLPAP